MHRLLTQVDVLHQLAFESNPKDWPSIIRLSRAFFQSTVPLIWRRVDGVQNLLTLIPAINVKLSQTHPKRVDRMGFRHGKSQDFTRFSLYAPFVKYLEIYGQDATEYEFSGWRELGQYAKAASLLPNLVRLTLTASFPIQSQQQLMWIRTFLAPAILEIQVVRTASEAPLIHLPTASSLLKHVSTVASGVQRLSLFIEHEDYYRPEEDADVIGFWEPLLQCCLGNLTALQELTCTEAVLDPEVFSVMAQLPNLRVLNIHAIGGAYSVWAALDRKCVPPNPFPALKHFSMRASHAADISIVLHCLAFPNLSSLRLGIEEQPDADHIIDDPAWEHEVIEPIVEGCPHLNELRIDFDEAYVYPQPCDLLASVKNSDAIKSMSKLPLETLYLSSAALGEIPETPDAALSYSAQYLMAAWPRVTRIHMPHCVGDFKGLYEFSQLPNLQELTLDLHLDCWSLQYVGEGLDHLTPGSSPLRVLGASYKTYISSLTLLLYYDRALLHFWPNLEQISLHLDPDDPDEGYSDILDDIEEVNGAIKSFREARC
ncbi:hypothetical protein FRC12_015606 [Ceratobasidium sp. 428]|nr:hypothetical protein FRC12_015606 [Ceratobasidium sp. 428]